MKKIFFNSSSLLKPKTKTRWLDLLQPPWLIPSQSIHYRIFEAYRLSGRAKEPGLRLLAKYSASKRNSIWGQASLPLPYCLALDTCDIQLIPESPWPPCSLEESIFLYLPTTSPCSLLPPNLGTQIPLENRTIRRSGKFHSSFHFSASEV